MKNKEKYLDELVDLLIEKEGFCVNNGKVQGCQIKNCNHQNCIFYRDDKEPCGTHMKEWLEQEHKEPIKLTDDEKVILRNVDKYFRWIARDKIGDLYLWGEKPYKKDVWWIDDWGTNFNFDIYSHLFQFIKWEDEVPYSIEELLND